MKSKYESQNLTEKIVPETESIALPKTCSERIVSNPHFARLLRQRLQRRHGNDTACGKALAELSDADLIASYLHNEARGKEHAAAKHRTERQAVTGYEVVE